MKVELINPYGYCVGVANVIKQIHTIAKTHPNDEIFCVGQVVHNQKVNESIESLGVKVLKGDKKELISKINSGVVIFSAHGTDHQLILEAKQKGLIVYDLVCPFVKKSFDIISKNLKENNTVIYIGVKKHAESEAALSLDKTIQFVTNVEDIDALNIINDNIVVINQTTLSILDIKDIYDKILKKYPNAKIIDEICNSTRIRQQVLLDKKINSDGLIIVGDKNSNNSLSLYDIAQKQGYDTLFISCLEDLDYQWLDNKKSISIMSGASTSQAVVEEIFEKIKKY